MKFNSRGNNPIVQTCFTADPAPVVFKDARYSDRLFVYTTHDAPGSDWFTMDYMMCYSTTDLVNWTHHGDVMSYADFKWAKKGTFWAPQVIDRNGKFYAYVPIEKLVGDDGSDGPQIGVGVSDSPYGPFTDALGEPLIHAHWDGDIDPTIFIDDDGTAYMYWGNPKLKYVKLKENMTELDGDVVHVPMTTESFGERVGGPSTDGKYPTAYEEGPWLLKRHTEGLKNPYYLIYAGGKLPEHIAYATAPTAEGPWTFGGTIMPTQEGAAFTIHPGIAEFKGQPYFFYHTQTLTGLEGFTGGFTRSVCVAKFDYNEDGSIPEIPMSPEGPPAIAYLDPYVKTEAETINWAERIKVERSSCIYVSPCGEDSFIRVKNVNFEKGAKIFTACISCDDKSVSASVEIFLSRGDGSRGSAPGTFGDLVGTLPVSWTSGWDNLKEVTTDVSISPGVYDLYFVFKSRGGRGDGSPGSAPGTTLGTKEYMHMDYWVFA